MAGRQDLHAASLLCVLIMPVGVLLTSFAIERPPAVGQLVVGIGLLAAGTLAVEYGYRFLAATGGDLGLTPGRVRLLQGLTVFHPAVMTVGLFSLLLEAGQAHFRACCVAYLAYAAGAVLVVAVRWRSWSAAELFYLRVGWVPAVAFGLPWLIPLLKSAGVIREFR
jgi:hypothetical protein